jgi:hypothetical protein
MMNEPIDFVRNAMVCNDRIGCHPILAYEIVARGYSCMVTGKRTSPAGRDTEWYGTPKC